MTQATGFIDDFGMDTITLAGPLEAKLAAMRAAGFGQVMLKANDIVGHPGGAQAAMQAHHAALGTAAKIGSVDQGDPERCASAHAASAFRHCASISRLHSL